MFNLEARTIEGWNKQGEDWSDPAFFVQIVEEPTTVLCTKIPRDTLFSLAPELASYCRDGDNRIFLPQGALNDDAVIAVVDAVVASAGKKEGFEMNTTWEPITLINIHRVLVFFGMKEAADVLLGHLWHLMHKYKLNQGEVGWIWSHFSAEVGNKHGQASPSTKTSYAAEYVHMAAWQVLNLQAENKLGSDMAWFITADKELGAFIEARKQEYGLEKGYEPPHCSPMGLPNPFTRLDVPRFETATTRESTMNKDSIAIIKSPEDYQAQAAVTGPHLTHAMKAALERPPQSLDFTRAGATLKWGVRSDDKKLPLSPSSSLESQAHLRADLGAPPGGNPWFKEPVASSSSKSAVFGGKPPSEKPLSSTPTDSKISSKATNSTSFRNSQKSTHDSFIFTDDLGLHSPTLFEVMSPKMSDGFRISPMSTGNTSPSLDTGKNPAQPTESPNVGANVEFGFDIPSALETPLRTGGRPFSTYNCEGDGSTLRATATGRAAFGNFNARGSFLPSTATTDGKGFGTRGITLDDGNVGENVSSPFTTTGGTASGGFFVGRTGLPPPPTIIGRAASFPSTTSASVTIVGGSNRNGDGPNAQANRNMFAFQGSSSSGGGGAAGGPGGGPRKMAAPRSRRNLKK